MTPQVIRMRAGELMRSRSRLRSSAHALADAAGARASICDEGARPIRDSRGDRPLVEPPPCNPPGRTDLRRLVALQELSAFSAADATFARRFVRRTRMPGTVKAPASPIRCGNGDGWLGGCSTGARTRRSDERKREPDRGQDERDHDDPLDHRAHVRSEREHRVRRCPGLGDGRGVGLGGARRGRARRKIGPARRIGARKRLARRRAGRGAPGRVGTARGVARAAG
jgi:hypothetical protein